MERTVATKKLAKIIGKGFGYRVDQKAPDQEGRDEARAKLPEASAKRQALEKQLNARRITVLQADAEYQQLKFAHEEARKHYQELASITCHYKIMVGTTNGMFFMVKAQGDTWEEIIRKVTKR